MILGAWAPIVHITATHGQFNRQVTCQ